MSVANSIINTAAISAGFSALSAAAHLFIPELFCIRHLTLQYLTPSQTFFHFLRRENGCLQTAHSLKRRSFFLMYSGMGVTPLFDITF
jgi:hypothetical protein